MAGELTANSFNIGRDMSFTMVINGVTYNFLGLVTDYTRKALSNMHEVVPVNNGGVPVRRTTYKGYQYEIHLTRQDGTVDALIDALQANFFNGETPPTVSAMETIRNPNQTVNMRQLTGGTIVPESAGAFKSQDPVNDIMIQVLFSQANNVGASAGINLNAPSSYL